MDDLPIYEEIIRIKKARIPAAVATVTETTGSTPRKAGAKMIVKLDGAISGTIGGGATEAETIEAAKEVIRLGRPRTLNFSLTEEHGGVCGGNLVIYLEPLVVPCHLIVVGAGHVGQAVTQAAHLAGFAVSLVSLSAQTADIAASGKSQYHPLDTLPQAFNEMGADANTYIFIASSDHRQDFQAVSAALKTPARYIAVIGSRKKKIAMDQYLLEAGFSAEEVGRVVSPAGLEIGAETPAEIAVSIVAQMINIRRSGLAEHHSHPACGRQITPDGVQQTIATAGQQAGDPMVS